MSRHITSFGLPPHVRAKLLAANFETKREILELSPLQLSSEAQLTPGEALEVLKTLREETKTSTAGTSTPQAASRKQGMSAFELLGRKKCEPTIFTYSQQLDALLGDGVQLGEVTEFCGVPGVGKTQLMMQLASSVQIPDSLTGAEGHAVYVDTEGSFIPDRQLQIAQALMDDTTAVFQQENEGKEISPLWGSRTAEDLLKNIHVFRIYQFAEQLAVVQTLPKFLQSHPQVKLLIIDSVAFHFRRGFEDLALRARLLTGMAQQLLSLAEKFNLAVVLTNQVTTKLDSGGFGGRLAPALGQSWAHACTHRIMMEWEGETRCAAILKSASRPMGRVPYVVNKRGIRDVEGMEVATQPNEQIHRKRRHDQMQEPSDRL
eukprot:gb/GEZN01005311.1/.p1 GENE.gb/GEZN01005311.1/~~gb/GEZN01005311.1/.p1  ORF type:complete len:375 (-),score=48.10 gb/GEZN01005311.1/:580-1704(-)